MAFPWLSYVNFEDGTRGTFDSETDSGVALDFPHYSELARVPGLAMPYRGAYCMRVSLPDVSTTSYVEETADWDMAVGETQYWRWMLWVSPDITMADTDEFQIFSLQSTGPADEVAVVINFTTADGLRIGIGESAGAQFLPLTTGVWHAVEVAVTLDTPAASDGTIDLTLDGSAATQVTGLTQAAVIQGRLGVMGIDAGTTKGVVLFDEVVSDDAQIYQPAIRFPAAVLMTATGHVFVGPGVVDNASLLSGAGTDCVLSLFDTDVANINDAGNIKAELKNTANNELVDPAGMPISFRRGCYAVLAGTNPRALVKPCSVVAWGSDGAIRNYGAKRIAPPGGV